MEVKQVRPTMELNEIRKTKKRNVKEMKTWR